MILTKLVNVEQIYTKTKSFNRIEQLFLLKKRIKKKKTELPTNKCFLLGKKVMTNLDSELKGRDTTLLTKIHLVKSMVFPVVMY